MGAPFTADELSTIISLRECRHPVKWPEVARRLGRDAWAGCAARYHRHRLETREAKAARPNQHMQRTCLACRAAFASEGPHNRLCDPCRGRADSPFEPVDDASTGDL